jgi:hypothetical protein
MFALFLCNALVIMALQELKRGREAPCGEKVYQTFSDVNPELSGSNPIA